VVKSQFSLARGKLAQLNSMSECPRDMLKNSRLSASRPSRESSVLEMDRIDLSSIFVDCLLCPLRFPLLPTRIVLRGSVQILLAQV